MISGSVVNSTQFCLGLLAVCLSPEDKIPENDSVIYNLNMKSKESPIVAYTDAIDIAVADKFFAISNLLKAFGFLDLYYHPAYRIEHLTGQFLYGFAEIF